MIDINLLSKEQKKDILLIRLYSTTKKSAMIIFVFAAACFMLLSAAKLYLGRQMTATQGNASLAQNQNRNLSSQVKRTNEEINAYLSILEISPRWSDLLNDLSDGFGGAIIPRRIKMNGPQGIMELSGIAKTREDLAEFQSKLRQSGWYADVKLPLEMLAAKENIAFNLQASINLEKILP